MFERDVAETALTRAKRRADSGGARPDDHHVDSIEIAWARGRGRGLAALGAFFGRELFVDAIDRLHALANGVLDQGQAGEIPCEVEAGNIEALEMLVDARTRLDGLALGDPERAVRADLLAQDDAAAVGWACDDGHVFLDLEHVERACVDARVAADAGAGVDLR